MAATWEIAGGHTVMFEANRSTALRNRDGNSIHPNRHPVIEKYFDTDPIATDSFEVSQGLEVCAPPYEMPW